MTNQTQPNTDVKSGIAYIYAVPDIDIDDEAVLRFLERSRRVPSNPITDAVADYGRRVEANEPYEDAMDVEEFRERYSG